MSRPLRYIPDGGALVEVTLRTIQGRYLLRPDKRGRVNELVLGVVGRAQRLYHMPLAGISVMSTHAHLLCVPEDAAQLAAFMGHVGGNLSKEIGRLHNWPGKLWERRYRAILVSDQEEDQIARLRYLLGAGVKENLVERARNWPGVHSARALTRDRPLRGWWFDRTREYAARRRGEHYGRYQYATEENVIVDPLPCWRHLPIKEVRRHVKDLIRDIEKEATTKRRKTGKETLGATAIMAPFRLDCPLSPSHADVRPELDTAGVVLHRQQPSVVSLHPTESLPADHPLTRSGTGVVKKRSKESIRGPATSHSVHPATLEPSMALILAPVGAPESAR